MYKNLLKHILVRILIFVMLCSTAVVLGLATLNRARGCGTGDGLAVFSWISLFYIIWTIFLGIEIFLLNKPDQKEKRRSNLIMALFFPVIIVLLRAYFELKNY